eukprot:Sspe_Gene.107163::Locus_85246_Transcript_1_1_Confidence_1.000_Length_887::g.107163::m.107163
MYRSTRVLLRQPASAFEKELLKLGDAEVQAQLSRQAVVRDRKLLQSTPLPLIRTADDTFRQTSLDARDAFATKSPTYPTSTVMLWADCKAYNTVLTFTLASITSRMMKLSGSARVTRRDAPLPQPDIDELAELLKQAPDQLLYSCDPTASGYQSFACGGYAAAQRTTHDALHRVYQMGLKRGLVQPQQRMKVVLHLRGYKLGRGGVVHAVKENEHLVEILETLDCTPIPMY